MKESQNSMYNTKKNTQCNNKKVGFFFCFCECMERRSASQPILTSEIQGCNVTPVLWLWSSGTSKATLSDAQGPYDSENQTKLAASEAYA